MAELHDFIESKLASKQKCSKLWLFNVNDPVWLSVPWKVHAMSKSLMDIERRSSTLTGYNVVSDNLADHQIDHFIVEAEPLIRQNPPRQR